MGNTNWYNTGYGKGKTDGYNSGNKNGYNTGYTTGYNQGIVDGKNFQLDIVIRIEGVNYAGVQASADSTITIKCVNGKITYTPAIGQAFGETSYNIWQGDQTWTHQRASIVSVTYTPL